MASMGTYQLFSQAPALVAVQRSRDLVFEFVNEAVRRVIGRDVVGERLRDVVPDERYVSMVEAVYERGERVVGTEVPLLAAERWFNFVHEPMRAADGSVDAVMTFGFDVTDLVNARRRNEEAVRELEATSRAKDEFLATVSHELRTPLSSIMGWASLLSERPNDLTMVRKAADVIHRNARAQAKLIDDILDVSRIVTGKLRIDAHPMSVATIVGETIEIVRPPATVKGIVLHVELDENAFVIGDDERLRQVVWNLLSNAIKFTERGGRVCVAVRCRDGAVTIEVTDSGCGIAPEFLPHVFERFRQADSSTTRTHGGLGLGLAIVRHLVELHGGHVAASSSGEGHGATFCVTLPAAADVIPGTQSPSTNGDRISETIPPSSHGKLAVPPPSLDGISVLVVDDENDARDVVAVALESWGATVTKAESVAEALATLERERPDVIVSDIGMPCEDGYAFIQTLRRAGGPAALVPAIALTAYARRADAERALASGFDFHVTKPIDPDDLRDVVGRALSRPSHSGNLR
jgi:signal transduction histidine kinase/ActR/RegA family two-component response regulator